MIVAVNVDALEGADAVEREDEVDALLGPVAAAAGAVPPPPADPLVPLDLETEAGLEVALTVPPVDQLAEAAPQVARLRVLLPVERVVHQLQGGAAHHSLGRRVRHDAL